MSVLCQFYGSVRSVLCQFYGSVRSVLCQFYVRGYAPGVAHGTIPIDSTRSETMAILVKELQGVTKRLRAFP